MMWNRRFDAMCVSGRIRVLVLLLVAAPWLWSCGSTVNPGQLGLKWRPVTTGLSKQPLREGFYMHMPWNDVITISYRWQSFSEQVPALTRDDLHIRLDASVVIRPIADELYQLQVDVGPDFYSRVVRPEFLTTTRSIAAEYMMTEIPEFSPEIETRILRALKERLTGKHLETDSVTITHIDFSAGMLRAIETKLAKEQEKIQKKFELEIASKDAEIARVRAKGEGDSLQIKAEGQAEAQKIRAAGQAEAQKLIDETLTAKFLQFKAFDSPNAKFIYVPTGMEGLPIIVSPEVK